MLTDPSVLSFPSAANITSMITACNAITVASDAQFLVDIAPGGTKRAGVHGADKFAMKISHSETKENPAPYKTSRTVIRFDQSRVDPNGLVVTLSAYMVAALPQGSLFTDAEKLTLIQAVAMYVLFGDNTAGKASGGTPPITRILNGEG